jgi:hypothetical protein
METCIKENPQAEEKEPTEPNEDTKKAHSQ